jgi:hypothetical protein
MIISDVLFRSLPQFLLDEPVGPGKVGRDDFCLEFQAVENKESALTKNHPNIQMVLLQSIFPGLA